MVNKKLFKWIKDNKMKANKDKCHLIISGKDKFAIYADSDIIEKSNCQKLFDLKFKKHLHSIKKAGLKVNALWRLLPMMNFEKIHVLMSSFFTLQFSYCGLVSMFHNLTMSNKMNHTQKMSCG